MAGRLQGVAALPTLASLTGGGKVIWPEYDGGPATPETQTYTLRLPDGSIDTSPEATGVPACEGWQKVLLGDDCKFDPIGGVTSGVSDAAGAAVGWVGSGIVKIALLGLAAILVVMGLWSMLRGTPIAQGFKEGIQQARSG